LATVGKEALIKRFGREGEKLYCLAHGLESPPSTRKSMSITAETVLEKDINDTHVLHRYIRYTTDKLCYLLKEHDMVIDRFSFHITYTDNKRTQKTKRFPSPTVDFLKLTHASEQLFDELYQRRVGIKSIKLVAPAPEPDSGRIDLFETTWDRKQQALGRGIADLRKRIGFSAILDANTVTLKSRESET
jgi:nucleotidyltransferase/DNA polymerase involved in DNA repair